VCPEDRRGGNLDRQPGHQPGDRGLSLAGPNPALSLTEGAGDHHRIMRGNRNKEIAHQLGTTEQVIKNYLHKVYDKLGVSDRLELALYCLHRKLYTKAPGTAATIGAPATDQLAINNTKL
jgi:DNA-binding CsgD family transcriptional regulator